MKTAIDRNRPYSGPRRDFCIAAVRSAITIAALAVCMAAARPASAQNIQDIAFSANPAPRFSRVVCTVVLDRPAPAGGLRVTLWSLQPRYAYFYGQPITISIPQGVAFYRAVLNTACPGVAEIRAAPSYGSPAYRFRLLQVQ